MSGDELKLAAMFDPATDDAWQALVEKALNGRDFDKVMSAHTYDGIRIDGLYTKDNARLGPRPQVKEGPWDIMAPHWNPDAKATNEAILEDLLRGATGIALRTKAGRFPGVAACDLASALEGVHLDMARLTLVPGEEFEAVSSELLNVLRARGYEASAVKASLGIDPIGTLAQTGRLKTAIAEACEKGAQISKEVLKEGWQIDTFMADSGPYHMAGATEAQELGILIATGVQYLRVLTDAGLSVDEAALQIAFSMAADADVSLTIAKFRAARMMWSAILKECGASEKIAMRLNGVTSLRMVTVNDPWVNILRVTAACFAAGVGGADTIGVLPHDTMLGMSSNFARRIARNVQIILQEESGLARVSDPAAGSYAFESITSDLASKAWEYFQKIEEAGGVYAALKGGAIQTNLTSAWELRRKNIAKRKDAITGVSEFPDIDEKPISNVGAMPPEPIADMPEPGETIKPLAFHRLAEDFEKLRAFSDACLEKNGARPLVFLGNIGTAADYTARSTFAKNFFEAGGIKAVSGPGSSEAVELVAEFKKSGAKIAVLCSTDAKYEAMAAEFAKELKDAGATVYLAGRPADSEALQAAGVTEFIYMGCDALEVLAQAHLFAGEGA